MRGICTLAIVGIVQEKIVKKMKDINAVTKTILKFPSFV